MMSLSPVPRAAEQLLVGAGRAGAVLGQCWAGVKLGCDLRLLSPRYLTGHKCSGSCGSEGFCGFKGFLQHFSHPDVASGNPCPHPADWDGQSMKISFGLEFRAAPTSARADLQGCTGLGRVLQRHLLLVLSLPYAKSQRGLGWKQPCRSFCSTPAMAQGRGVLSSATASKCFWRVTARSNQQCHIPQYHKVSFPWN